MISIVTVCYNSSRTIRNCINSVKKQSYKDIEHIFVDGNSSDTTCNIIKDLNPNSLLLSEPDNGLYDALNKGLNLCSGDLICLLHSDDEFADPEVLRSVYNFYSKTNSNIIYTDINYVNNSLYGKKVLRRWRSCDFSLKKLNRGWMPPHTGVFLDRNFAEKIECYDTQFIISSDFDYIQRAFRNNLAKPRYLPLTSVEMKVGGISNRSFTNIIKKSLEDYFILKRYVRWPTFALFLKNISKIRQFLVT